MKLKFDLQLFADLGIRTVKTLEGLQKVLADPKSTKISIIGTISIEKDAVIDFNGKTVKLAESFARDSVFTLSSPNISLTLKSSNGSGGIVPTRLNQGGGLVLNDTQNSTVTFDAGFDVDYSKFKNFNIVMDTLEAFGNCPVNVKLNFSGANIKTNRQIYAYNINISGGSINYTGEDSAIVIADNGTFNMSGGTIFATKHDIYSKSLINISGGKIISRGKNYSAVFVDGSNAVISISDGTFISVSSCVYLINGAKGKITGGTFEGHCAIGIEDSSTLTDEVRGATFNTKCDYGLVKGACLLINDVNYTNTGEIWSAIKLQFNDSDKTKIYSVSILNGAVEVKDTLGVRTLNTGDNYSYVETADDEYFHGETFDETINYWQAHLFKNYALHYRTEILAALYFGLQTDKLILLVGNPGTGKTTLVKYLAKSFGFEDAAIIPVQPNWTDKGDLLGYYNPIDKNYMATEFLEALIKFSNLAKNQPDKIFIICLDEMNLAHIEYYFAEFLSALQTDRKISLYSESIRENIQRELQIGGFDLNSDIEFDANAVLEMNVTERQYYLDLWRMYDMMKKFPAVLTIPPNVKFFGTLNQDETTLDVSPKVIDRAYIIRLEMSDEKLNFDGDFKNTLEYKPIESYRQGYITLSSDLAKNLKDSMNAVAPISYRLIAQIFNNENFKTWQGVMGGKSLADFIISSCFLPKVRLDEDAYKIKIDALKKLCAGHTLSEKIFNDIDTGIEADYWRR